MTCSESGPTPSSSVAALTSASTAADSDSEIRPRTLSSREPALVPGTPALVPETLALGTSAPGSAALGTLAPGSAALGTLALRTSVPGSAPGTAAPGVLPAGLCRVGLPPRDSAGSRPAASACPAIPGRPAISANPAGVARHVRLTGGRIRLAGCAGRYPAGIAHPAGISLVLGRDKTVPDVADGSDQQLVLDAELGPQPADMHIDRAGAAEVVVAPYFLEQLRPGEHPGRVLGEELQQLEFLEGQVQRAAAQPCQVAGFVDDEIAAADLAGSGQHRDCPAADGKPEPRVDFAGARGVQDHVIRAPVSGDGGPAAFGHHGKDGHLEAGHAQLSHQALGLHKITTCINQHHVSGRTAGHRGSLGRRQPDRMRQQA